MNEIQTIRDALNARKPDQMTTAWVQYADAMSALDALEKLLPPEGETRYDCTKCLNGTMCDSCYVIKGQPFLSKYRPAPYSAKE